MVEVEQLRALAPPLLDDPVDHRAAGSIQLLEAHRRRLLAAGRAGFAPQRLATRPQQAHTLGHHDLDLHLATHLGWRGAAQQHAVGRDALAVLGQKGAQGREL